MNEPIDATQWSEYLKTPCRKTQPVKLEYIVAARIEAFMKAKKVKASRQTVKGSKKY